MLNLRRHPRVPSDAPVCLELRQPGGGQRNLVCGRVLNLSRGGLLARVDGPVRAYCAVNVVLALGSERLSLPGLSLRSRDLGHGCCQVAVCFDPSSPVLERIVIHVEAALPDEAALEPPPPVSLWC